MLVGVLCAAVCGFFHGIDDYNKFVDIPVGQVSRCFRLACGLLIKTLGFYPDITHTAFFR
jgi:hypothetical protein